MQKIRHFIKSIKELCYDMNRSLPRKLSLCIAFPLFLLYSLELISGYYHQFTVFSIPTVLIFFDRKEFKRYGRNISIPLFIEELERPYNLMCE